MRDALRRTLDTYDARRTALLDEVAVCPDAVLTRRPAPERWSILEIAEHLAVSERDVLGGLPAPDALVPARSPGFGRARRWLLGCVLRSRLRVSVPSRAMMPTGVRSLADIRALWDENMAWLRSRIDHADERRLAEAVFSHPVSGPLTTAEVLVLADLHLTRHWKQIRQRYTDRDGA
ncbi:MAG: DinB family protein [Bacteroidota bacterium]